jgi:hypothetical protein
MSRMTRRSAGTESPTGGGRRAFLGTRVGIPPGGAHGTHCLHPCRTACGPCPAC